MKKLIAILILILICYSADARNLAIYTAGVPVAGCTSASGTIFAEGFETTAANCTGGSNTWSITGSFDCHTASPASAPAGVCDYSGYSASANSTNYILYNHGSAYTYPLVITIPMYITTLTIGSDYNGRTLFRSSNANSGYGSSYLTVAKAGGVYYLFPDGASSGTYTVIAPTNTWFVMKLTLAATAANSKWQCTSGCNDSTEYGYTRQNENTQYLRLGPEFDGGAGDAATVYYGYIVIN
jgi:hypothetical protein